MAKHNSTFEVMPLLPEVLEDFKNIEVLRDIQFQQLDQYFVFFVATLCPVKLVLPTRSFNPGVRRVTLFLIPLQPRQQNVRTAITLMHTAMCRMGAAS